MGMKENEWEYYDKNKNKKKSVGIRLSPRHIKMLLDLSIKLNNSKNRVIELAIKNMWEKEIGG
jgi:hypothetical protein